MAQEITFQNPNDMAHLGMNVSSVVSPVDDALVWRQEAERAKAELAKYQNEARTSAAFTPEVFKDLQSVDEADARRISSIVLSATNAMLDPLRKELASTQMQTAKELEAAKAQLAAQQVNRVADRITNTHPDFFTVAQTPEFKSYMAERPEGMSRTRDELAAEEVYKGNADYTINLLNRFKATTAPAGVNVSVPPVQVATHISGGAPKPASNPDLPSMKELLRNRTRMSAQDFSMAIQRLESAQSAEGVK